MAPAVDLYVLPAPRFATTHLLLAFRRRLSADTVTRGALLPRVLRRGTRRWPDRRALTSHLEELYGADVGATASKAGDQQVLELSFSSAGPVGPAGPAGHGMALLIEMLVEPSPPDPPAGGLRPDYVREEGEALARDISGLADDRMAYAHFRCTQEMCTGEPFALHSLGRAEDLEAITPDILEAFRREILAEDPLSVYLAGPAKEGPVREVSALLVRLLEAASAAPGLEDARPGAGRRPLPPSAPHPRPERSREVFEPAEVEQGRLVIGLETGVLLGTDDHPAQVLYNGLLGGFVHSRLFKRIREEAGLAYYAYSRVVPTKGVILISCGIQEKNYGRAVGLVRRELEALARGDFTKAEFEATRNSALAVARGQLDSPSALIYGHLEHAAAGQVLEEIAPWRRLARVTADEVRAFARRPVLDTIYLLGRQRPDEEG